MHSLDWYYGALTIPRLLAHGVLLSPDEPLHYRDEYSIAYRELGRRVAALAAALHSLGLEAAGEPWGMGDRVATLDWNTLWHLEAYLAVPSAGLVLHPVNIRLAPLEIAYVMNHARDRVAIVSPEFLGLLERIAPMLKHLEHVFILPGPGSEEAPSRIGGARVSHYEDLVKPHLRGQGLGPGEAILHEDTVALMSYTSGTTGSPKGVTHTHRQAVLHALSLALHLSAILPEEMRLSHYSTVLHIVPMFHAYSWGLPYAATLLGAGQVYPGRFNPRHYLELVKRHRVTHTAGVPTVLHMLLDAAEQDPSLAEALQGLVYMTGGSALPKALAERAKRHGMRIVASYGMTETAPVLTVSTVKRGLTSLAEEERFELLTQRSGIPLPLSETIVADPETLEPVPRDSRTIGEVVTRAPWTTRGYHMDPEKTEKAWRGGWFHTGDLAVWDHHGYIQVIDRTKDIIKSGGEWISSIRLENLITQHPCVAEAAVVAAEHPKWQERPVAVVAPKPGCSLEPNSIIEHLKKQVEQGVIPKWWLPDKIIITPELPKTSVGKIDKKKLRQKYRKILLENNNT